MMKVALLLSFLASVTASYVSRQPQYEWDPDTVEDCVEWYNNGYGETCEYVRDYFTITPEEFHAWNPSLGVDCKPWRFQSYCIVTQGRLDKFSKTMTTPASTITKTTTSSTSTTIAPSPTAWEALGCYVDDATNHVLEKLMSSKGGDAALTIPKCQDMCYRVGLRFAGVEAGNQCWCSSYVAGEFAKNASECDTSCSGDKATTCGGKDRLHIFQAEKPDETSVPVIGVSKSSSVESPLGSATPSHSPIPSQSSSGAMRNLAMF